MKITRQILEKDIDIELTQEEVQHIQSQAHIKWDMVFTEGDFALAYIERHGLYGTEPPYLCIDRCLAEHAEELKKVIDLWGERLCQVTIDEQESLSSMLNSCIDAVEPIKKTKIVYEPHLEIVKKYGEGSCVQDVFTDWGSYETEAEARNHIYEAVKYAMEHKELLDEDCYWSVCIEVDEENFYDSDDWHIVDVIEVIEEIH